MIAAEADEMALESVSKNRPQPVSRGDVVPAKAAVEHEREDACENEVTHRGGHPMCADGGVSE